MILSIIKRGRRSFIHLDWDYIKSIDVVSSEEDQTKFDIIITYRYFQGNIPQYSSENTVHLCSEVITREPLAENIDEYTCNDVMHGIYEGIFANGTSNDSIIKIPTDLNPEPIDIEVHPLLEEEY